MSWWTVALGLHNPEPQVGTEILRSEQRFNVVLDVLDGEGFPDIAPGSRKNRLAHLWLAVLRRDHNDGDAYCEFLLLDLLQ